ncbi:MAG: ATP-binding cassette domain-containing protein [Chloroflexi bacterium]|nr:MAG: ATP-binding cassette domain-containing protein [Chloroflexota bacterium]MBL1196123.1 ATP-binding cassette domain-containing protein [Chloroflexota bacterium]NOH13416.1 ATP-binding cassette domain-containing protein [Chloroflexota bacterium]
MNTNGMAISTRGLVKRFDEEVLAVDSIDLSIPVNTIYALLGPNGAGKTTTVSMLTTLVEPTSGQAQISGLDVVQQADKVRQRIGVTFQEIVLDPDLTGRESLDFHARLYGIGKAERLAKIDELLKLVELDEAADRRTNTYSGGMKRRLELARGLITSPEVLFLDEPTQGLDPQNRTNIWQYIRNLKADTNMTLLLTTHYMDEAEALADRVGIMDQGKIVVEGTPAELVDQMGSDNIRVVGRGNSDAFCEKVKTLSNVETVNKSNGIIQVGVDSGNRRLVEIVEMANDSGFGIEDISVSKPSLGDVFLKYTGRQLRDI